MSSIAGLLKCLTEFADADPAPAARAIELITDAIQDDELSPQRLEAVRKAVGPIASRGDHATPLATPFALLAACCNDVRGRAIARAVVESTEERTATRLQALESLMFLDDPDLPSIAAKILADKASNSTDFRARLLTALGPLDDPRVADFVLEAYPKLEPELRVRAVDLLTQRPDWSKRLLKEIEQNRVPREALHVNQVRKLLAGRDAEVAKLVAANWGKLREGRNPAREQVVNRMMAFLRKTPGDPHSGDKVFKKLCGECHKIYGSGQDVGPDLTSNGRNDFEQLVSNVFDPSLVIGNAYQATIVATRDGRVLNGLLVEQSPERVVLKLQGGKLETIPRAEVEELKLSSVSLMPEDLEKQLTPEEIADLFAFLALDKPPSDPTAKRLPGTPAARVRTTQPTSQP
jgi:putative heme-binding domain-containing protein